MRACVNYNAVEAVELPPGRWLSPFLLYSHAETASLTVVLSVWWITAATTAAAAVTGGATASCRRRVLGHDSTSHTVTGSRRDGVFRSALMDGALPLVEPRAAELPPPTSRRVWCLRGEHVCPSGSRPYVDGPDAAGVARSILVLMRAWSESQTRGANACFPSVRRPRVDADVC